MCSPCVCYKYEDCGPSKGKASKNDATNTEADSARKKDEMENVLKRTKSRELRAGIMYYSCHCIKRNGLQHDCRRTGCGGQPECLVLPDPLCPPSQLARARGLADPAPLAPHYAAAAAASGGGGASGRAGKGQGKPATDPTGLSGGKQYVVCEIMTGVLNEDGQIKNIEKCADGGGGASKSTAHASKGTPVYVMKLCESK